MRVCRLKSNACYLAKLILCYNTSSHDKTGFYLKRGSDILTSVIRHALESGLFPLSQHPINTNRVRAVPLVLDPQLLPR